MANLNCVLLIGRLTRDPECRTFATGGKNAKFGFVNNSRRKGKNGEWEDEPMFIDVEVWNRGEFGKTADFVENNLAKGSNVAIRGELRLDQWDDKATGQKRSKHKIVADSIQLLDKRERQDGPAASDVPANPAASNDAGDEFIPF